MERLEMVASYAKILPTPMLWSELAMDTNSNTGATRVCAELRLRGAL